MWIYLCIIIYIIIYIYSYIHIICICRKQLVIFEEFTSFFLQTGRIVVTSSMLFPPGLSNTFIAASLSFCSSGSRGKLRLTPSKRMIIYDNDQWSMVLKCRKPPWFIGFSPYITIRTEWFLSSAKIFGPKMVHPAGYDFPKWGSPMDGCF